MRGASTAPHTDRTRTRGKVKKPLAIELFAGLHGWGTELARVGFSVIGFDIVDMCAALGQLRLDGCAIVLQNVLTLHGRQFKDANIIVASPPCQEFSYMAQPWSRGKQIAGALREEVPFPEPYTGSRTIAELTALFNACFRIQREASEASGRYIPMVVENVRGAQPWVGRSRANYGSYHLWGDVESVGGRIIARGGLRFGMETLKARRSVKVEGFNFHQFEKTGRPGGSFQSAAVKVQGLDWSKYGQPGYKAQGFNVVAEQRARAEGRKLPPGHDTFAVNGKPCNKLTDPASGSEGVKQGGNWWHDPDSLSRRHSSKSPARKAASARIAKIPPPLARYIAEAFKPNA